MTLDEILKKSNTYEVFNKRQRCYLGKLISRRLKQAGFPVIPRIKQTVILDGHKKDIFVVNYPREALPIITDNIRIMAMRIMNDPENWGEERFSSEVGKYIREPKNRKRKPQTNAEPVKRKRKRIKKSE